MFPCHLSSKRRSTGTAGKRPSLPLPSPSGGNAGTALRLKDLPRRVIRSHRDAGNDLPWCEPISAGKGREEGHLLSSRLHPRLPFIPTVRTQRTPDQRFWDARPCPAPRDPDFTLRTLGMPFAPHVLQLHENPPTSKASRRCSAFHREAPSDISRRTSSSWSSASPLKRRVPAIHAANIGATWRNK